MSELIPGFGYAKRPSVDLYVFAEVQDENGHWMGYCDRHNQPIDLWEYTDSGELSAFFGLGKAPDIHPISKIDDHELTDLSPKIYNMLFVEPLGMCLISCFTLTEIQHWDLSQFRIHYGYISSELAPLFGDGLQPYPWKAFHNGIPSPKIKPSDTPFHGLYNVKVTWVMTYAEIFSGFFDCVIPKLEQLGPPDRVRMIVTCC